MSQFQFKILTGVDFTACKQKYDNIASKDPYTFYLLDHGGHGYLGDTLLFGGDNSRFQTIATNATASTLLPNMMYFVTNSITVTDGTTPDPVSHSFSTGSIFLTDNNKIVSDFTLSSFTTYMANYIATSADVIRSDNANLDSTYAGSDSTILTSAAVKALINANISAQSILDISFFSGISDAIEITSAHITAGKITYRFNGDSSDSEYNLTANDHEGDIGIMFKIQTGPEGEDGDDTCTFINLHGLINLYEPDTTTQTTQITISNDANNASNHTKRIKVEVNKSTEANMVSKISSGVDNLKAGNAYAANDLSTNKFITEKQFAEVVANLLKDYVKYSSE